MKIESEIRFVFPFAAAASVQRLLRPYEFVGRYHELTEMYDNPNPQMTFYAPEVDGRLRLRSSERSSSDVGDRSIGASGPGLLTWKRRMKNTTGDSAGVRREEEIEISVFPEQVSSVRSLIEVVLRCPRVSSYERYRGFYLAPGVEIVLDEFPYGLVVEVEAKDGSEDDIARVVAELGLSTQSASRLSCDDLYRLLCRRNNVIERADISFADSTMPLVPGTDIFVPHLDQ